MNKLNDAESAKSNLQQLPGSIPEGNLVKYELLVVTGKEKGSGTGW